MEVYFSMQFIDPSMTKKQIKKINNLNFQDVKKALEKKKDLVEFISGKKFDSYKLQRINKLKYILNSETPAILILVDIPNKGRINLKIKKMEDKVLS